MSETVEELAKRTRAFFDRASLSDVGHALIQLDAQPELGRRVRDTFLRLAEERLAKIRHGLGSFR